MSNFPLKRLTASLLLVTMSTLPACVESSSDVLTPAGTRRALNSVEGRRIEGSISSQVVRRTAGGVERGEIPAESFNTVVRQGFGVLRGPPEPYGDRSPHWDRRMLVAAADFPQAVETKRLQHTDSLGRKHEFVATMIGRRPTSFQYRIDGRQFAHVETRWEKRGGLYLATGQVGTITQEGNSAIVTTSLRTRVGEPLSFHRLGTSLETNLFALYSALGPQPASAQEFTMSVHCAIAIAEFMGALTVLAASWEAAFITWFAAYTLFGAAWANLVWECYMSGGE
jgi:hypothetical protein